MDSADLRVRNATYGLFVEYGRAPTPGEVGAAALLEEDAVADAWHRLHEAHALVLTASGTSIRMANPFSGVPTAYRVQAAGRWWYANCAWDAFGICAALHTDGVIATSCVDCGGEIRVAVRSRRPDDGTLVFHCLLPAAVWWDDIAFT